MTEFQLPKTHDFQGGELVEVSHLEKTFNISRRTALKYLHVLRICPMYIGKDIFFSLPTFNKIMFVLSRPGSPGFLFPGSKAKNIPHLRKSKNFIIEVTDEILAQAASPQIMGEMAATGGRDPSMVKKLIAYSNSKKVISNEDNKTNKK